jgi:hypothetical protein
LREGSEQPVLWNDAIDPRDVENSEGFEDDDSERSEEEVRQPEECVCVWGPDDLIVAHH